MRTTQSERRTCPVELIPPMLYAPFLLKGRFVTAVMTGQPTLSKMGMRVGLKGDSLSRLTIMRVSPK